MRPVEEDDDGERFSRPFVLFSLNLFSITVVVVVSFLLWHLILIACNGAHRGCCLYAKSIDEKQKRFHSTSYFPLVRIIDYIKTTEGNASSKKLFIISQSCS